MGWASAFAGALVALTQSGPVDLSLVLPEKAVIETRLESSERQNGGEWTISTNSYRVEVRAEGEQSYRTVWRDLDDPESPGLIILTDEALVPNRIVNIDEVLDALPQALGVDGGSAKDNVSALEFLRGLPPETLTALLAKNLILTAYGQGTALIPGERQEYQQPGGSFGDSGPLSMNASFLLESVKPDLERAVVVWINELDPIEARKALPGLMNDLFGLAGADRESIDKMEALLADARFVVRTECRYEIDIPTGLAERVECKALQDVSIAGENRRKETRLVATQRLLD